MSLEKSILFEVILKHHQNFFDDLRDKSERRYLKLKKNVEYIYELVNKGRALYYDDLEEKKKKKEYFKSKFQTKEFFDYALKNVNRIHKPKRKSTSKIISRFGTIKVDSKFDKDTLKQKKVLEQIVEQHKIILGLLEQKGMNRLEMAELGLNEID